MGLIVTGLLLSASVSPSFAAVEAVQTYEVSEWSNVIYYMATLSGIYGQKYGYGDITVKINAVDEYKLYVNGTERGTGSAETIYENVNVDSKYINIAVEVTNTGKGNGNGLIVDIQAGSDQLGTSIKVRESLLIDGVLTEVPISWWTFDADTKETLGFGDDWYIFDEGLLKQVSKTKLMRHVFEGKVIFDITGFFSKPVTGYLQTDADIGYVNSEGDKGIGLRRLEGENIAFGKPSEYAQLTDGDLSNGFNYMSRDLGDTKYVDLKRLYKVNKMTVYTGGDKPTEYEKFSLRGYAVEISLDQFRWEEVGVIHDIGVPDKDGIVNEGGLDNYSIEFPPEWARYVRYKATELRVDNPKIGEIMAFGLGHSLEGFYESDWIDFGSADKIKNFKEVQWEGNVPDGTQITIQTMTKNGSDGFSSGWSEPSSTGQKGSVIESFMITSPEPATHIKYKINISTQDPNQSPVLEKIAILYSSDNQPVTYADGYITPNRVPMGVDTTFVYSVAYNLAAGQNIGSLGISVPGPAVLSSVYSSDLGANIAGATATMSDDLENLVVTFASLLTDTNSAVDDTLHVSFVSKLFKSNHTFEGYLYGVKGGVSNDNAGGIKVWESSSISNSVIASTISKNILNNVKAVPKVFSPNGDNKNDVAVIEFSLAKVETVVKINIYNTAGKLITTICDDFLKAEDYSLPYPAPVSAALQNLPGYWDGKDEDGDLVTPGIYIYQIIAKADEGDVVEGGTVVVAY